MGDEENWDLSAIVRSCTPNKNEETGIIIQGGNPLDCLGSLTFNEEDDPFCFLNLVHPKPTSFQELEDSYKPFLPANNASNIPIPISIHSVANNNNNHDLNNIPTTCTNSTFISDFGGIINNLSGVKSHPPPLIPLLVHQQQQQQQPPPTSLISISPHLVNSNSNIQDQQRPPRVQRHQQQQNERGGGSLSVLPLQSHHQPPRSRKKKSHQKRLVLQVTAENLSNDMWAWRKYGQKPIKGSPYPRNYYRCSSSKGCGARKQVERSNTDPNMFVVSYSGDHTHPRPTHRNSLAGSTRNKFSSSSSITPPPPPIPTNDAPPPVPQDHMNTTSAAATTSLSPTTPPNHLINLTNMSDVCLGADDHQYIEEEEDDDDDQDEEDEEDNDILIPNIALNRDDIVRDFHVLGGPSTVSGITVTTTAIVTIGDETKT